MKDYLKKAFDNKKDKPADTAAMPDTADTAEEADGEATEEAKSAFAGFRDFAKNASGRIRKDRPTEDAGADSGEDMDGEAVAEADGEATEEAKSAFAGFREFAKNASGRVWVSTSGFAEKGLGKINEMTEELKAALPFIDKAGFRLEGLEMVLGVPPAIVASFEYEEAVSEEEAKNILSQMEEGKVSTRIVSSLLKVQMVRRVVDIKSLPVMEVEIEVSLFPSVRVRYQHEKKYMAIDPNRPTSSAGAALLESGKEDTPEP